MNNFLNRLYASNWQSSILAGIFLGVSFPPFNLFLLAIPAFMLLFRITDRCTSARQVMYFTYPAFLVWNIIATYWLTLATVAGGISAILANSAIMTLPFAGIYFFRKSKFHPVLISVIAASLWVTYEFLHYRWDLAWPWLTVGNAFANAPVLIQYVSITGVMGVSFWVVVTASLLQRPRHHSVESGRDSIMHRLKHLPTSLIIFLFPLISFIMYFTYNSNPVSHTEIVVAQPNYDSYLHNSGYSDINVALEELIELTNSVRTSNTAAIFWPENALMHNIIHYQERNPVSRLLDVAAEWDAPIITGATWYKYYLNDDHPTVYKEFTDGQKHEVYNAAIGFFPNRDMLVYEKANLVPIVERMPFLDFFGRFQNPWIDWRKVPSYGRGSELVNYTFDGVTSPALICYDSVFPDWNRRFVKNGADFITVITNDGWWGNSSGHIQHYDFARIRAIETRRAIVRSANNGISGMIYPSGQVHSKTEYWTRTALRLSVPINHHLTFYVKYGDWIGYFSILLVLVSSVFLIRTNIRSNGSKQ